MEYQFNLPNDNNVVDFLRNYNPSESFSTLSAYSAIAALGAVERRTISEKAKLDTKTLYYELYAQKRLYLQTVVGGRKPTVDDIKAAVFTEPNYVEAMKLELDLEGEAEKYKNLSNVLLSILKSSSIIGNE